MPPDDTSPMLPPWWPTGWRRPGSSDASSIAGGCGTVKHHESAAEAASPDHCKKESSSESETAPDGRIQKARTLLFDFFSKFDNNLTNRNAHRGADCERQPSLHPSSITEKSISLRPSEEGHKSEHKSKGDPEGASDEEDSGSCLGRIWDRWNELYSKYRIILLLVAYIAVARAFPALGAIYLKPHITASWVAVCFIFVLSGLSLETQEFSKAGKQIKFNFVVQFYTFVVVSSMIYGVSTVLATVGALSDPLAQGMVICATLPSTTNSVTVLTKASGGDEAAAIFNSVLGNMLGVFVSPLLILFYVGVAAEAELMAVFYKLSLRVILPVVVGQILRSSGSVVCFVKKRKAFLRRAQIHAMLYISYVVFCRAFYEGKETELTDILVLVLFTFVSYLGLMLLIWFLLGKMFPMQPRLRVMGFFGGTLKTVAMGVPLIEAMYEGDPQIALYTLPLLVAYPLQLLVGSFCTPYLKMYIKKECSRLGIKDDDSDYSQSDSDGDSSDGKKSDPVATGIVAFFMHSPLSTQEPENKKEIMETSQEYDEEMMEVSDKKSSKVHDRKVLEAGDDCEKELVEVADKKCREVDDRQCTSKSNDQLEPDDWSQRKAENLDNRGEGLRCHEAKGNDAEVDNDTSNPGMNASSWSETLLGFFPFLKPVADEGLALYPDEDTGSEGYESRSCCSHESKMEARTDSSGVEEATLPLPRETNPVTKELSDQETLDKTCDAPNNLASKDVECYLTAVPHATSRRGAKFRPSEALSHRKERTFTSISMTGATLLITGSFTDDEDENDGPASHECDDADIMYNVITEPRLLCIPAGTRCSGDCGVTFGLSENGIGQLPSPDKPVLLCMHCLRHALCYRCWKKSSATSSSKDARC